MHLITYPDFVYKVANDAILIQTRCLQSVVSQENVFDATFYSDCDQVTLSQKYPFQQRLDKIVSISLLNRSFGLKFISIFRPFSYQISECLDQISFKNFKTFLFLEHMHDKLLNLWKTYRLRQCLWTRFSTAYCFFKTDCFDVIKKKLVPFKMLLLTSVEQKIDGLHRRCSEGR